MHSTYCILPIKTASIVFLLSYFVIPLQYGKNYFLPTAKVFVLCIFYNNAMKAYNNSVFNKSKILIVFLSVALSVTATAMPFITKIFHKYYVSICEIDHNPKQKKLEISLKLFFDDIAYTLEKQYNIKLDQSHNTTQLHDENIDQYLFDYINENLEINVNGKTLKLEWVGKELEQRGEILWCYIEAPKVANPNRIAIHNTLLFDFFPEQVNLVHIKANNKRHSLTLDKGQPNGEFICK